MALADASFHDTRALLEDQLCMLRLRPVGETAGVVEGVAEGVAESAAGAARTAADW